MDRHRVNPVNVCVYVRACLCVFECYLCVPQSCDIFFSGSITSRFLEMIIMTMRCFMSLAGRSRSHCSTLTLCIDSSETFFFCIRSFSLSYFVACHSYLK